MDVPVVVIMVVVLERRGVLVEIDLNVLIGKTVAILVEVSCHFQDPGRPDGGELTTW